MQPGHAVYRGKVGHCRYLPRLHKFEYRYTSYWLDCRLLKKEQLAACGISDSRFAALSFRRDDYLAGAEDLTQAVRDKVVALGGDSGIDAVFLLTPLANWGYYFSPITLYYCYDAEGEFCCLLAEVSNTPWNERHYYLLQHCAQSEVHQQDKQFHVSPFNPMDMTYHWVVPAPDALLKCQITNKRQGKAVFSAWFNLQRKVLDRAERRKILIRLPWQNVQIISRIYWQALKLLVKGMPLYPHPKS